MRDPLTLAGIEPATFRIVAQHLNHCATAVPSPLLCTSVNNSGIQWMYRTVVLNSRDKILYDQYR